MDPLGHPSVDRTYAIKSLDDPWISLLLYYLLPAGIIDLSSFSSLSRLSFLVHRSYLISYHISISYQYLSLSCFLRLGVEEREHP
ncbi:hypothetical protein GGR54DRAFT_606502 [Hypoxylon sp. NC1633]|nr:hypothetical protein GGR54DRAFT_606502 [Hypoxylon sp. NC1633]